jgi:hypothetical protein
VSAIESSSPTASVPPGGRWLLPALTSGLALLAAFQLIQIPKCISVAHHLGRQPSGTIAALSEVPLALALAGAVVLAGLAFRHRRSAPRSALLATVAVSVNFGLQTCIFASLGRWFGRLGFLYVLGFAGLGRVLTLRRQWVRADHFESSNR